MWKIKISGLRNYEDVGFEFFKDEHFLYVFDRYLNKEDSDEPLAIFSKNTKLKVLKGCLKGYMSVRDLLINPY